MSIEPHARRRDTQVGGPSFYDGAAHSGFLLPVDSRVRDGVKAGGQSDPQEDLDMTKLTVAAWTIRD